MGGMGMIGGGVMGGGMMGKGGHGMGGGYSMAPIVISAPSQSYQQPMPMPMYSKGGKRRRSGGGGFGGGDNMRKCLYNDYFTIN